MDDILTQVFGVRKLELSTIRSTISHTIQSFNDVEPGHRLENNTSGRLGPRKVQLSRTSNLGPLVLSEGDTEIEAHCHLGSALATVCVHEGKWQYEATLGTAGLQQIGWAPLTCAFTNEEGVGDSKDSYAFDGKRVFKWHDGQEPYGQAWVAGDVIGSCLDLENGTITFYRNGVSMGVAFTRVRKGLGYFPAISLSYGERCLFNFGRRPFEYPVEGFSPLQEPSPLASVSPTNSNSVASYLINRVRDLLRVDQQLRLQPSHRSRDDVLITASILFEYLVPFLLSEYHVVDMWYPFLHSLSVEGGGSLETVVEWMQLFMEDYEWKQCMEFILQYLGFKCRTTGLIQAIQPETHKSTDLPPVRSCYPLALVLDLLRVRPVLDFAISAEGVFSLLELYFTFKQPSKLDLATLLPCVWWQGAEGDPSSFISESRFLHDLSMMNAYIQVYEDLIYELIVVLRYADITFSTTSFLFTHVENSSATLSQSTSFFCNWLNYMITKNKGANRNVVPLGLSSSSVLVSIYFALLRLLFSGKHPILLTATELDAFSSLFHKTTGTISEFSRLGGALGHLQKTITKEPGQKTTDQPLEVVIMDAAVNLYHLGVSSRFKASSQQQNTVLRDIAQLNQARNELNQARNEATATDATARLDAAVLLPRVVDGLRLVNYSRAILVGDKVRVGQLSPDRERPKQEIMYKKTVYLAEFLLTLSQQGSVFSFVPAYYMESMVDCFHSLRRAVPPLPFTTELPYRQGLEVIITALITFFNDARIINPDVRDLLLQSLGVLMQYSEYVAVVESLAATAPGASVSASTSSTELSGTTGPAGPKGERVQVTLLRGLLQAFDTKFWVTATPILVRFWKGFGLGQVMPPSTAPSMVFRSVFAEVVDQDEALLNTFLNNLFNVLNSTVSEFFAMKLDASMSSNDIRKANFLFELSINLLRVVEFVSMEKPESFLGSEINLMRLVELLLLILTRTGPAASRLDSVLVLEPHVSRAWILAPLVGILLNLDSHSEDSRCLYDALLSDASFKMEAFDYLLQFSWQQVTPTTNWLKTFEAFVAKLRVQEATRKSSEDSAAGLPKSASIELCSICYSAPIDTQFEPCKHSSCHRCISRHLLNNKRCFFCNADVESTHPVNT